MLKKILKGIGIWTGVSWTLYGMSVSVLNHARYNSAKRSGLEDIPKPKYQLAVKVAFDNFKKAYELLK